MFNKLKKLFSKKTEIIEQDFTASVFELWISDFTKEKNRRFIEETGDGYKSYFENGFNLELFRKELFAWTTNPQYQYRNLCIETELDFSKIDKLIPETESHQQPSIENAGYCAFGIMFRCVNDSNYYMV